MIDLEQLPDLTPDDLQAAAAGLAKDEAGILQLMTFCLMQAQTITEQAAQIDGLHAALRSGPAIHITYPKDWTVAGGALSIPIGSLFTPN